MIVFGIDPGFANLGWATIHARLDRDDVWHHRLIACGIIRTKPEAKRRKIYESTDLIRRMKLLRWGLVGVEHVLPGSKDRVGTIDVCSYIAAEQMSYGHRGSKAGRVLGMSWGIILSIAESNGKAIVEVNSRKIKALSIGTGATKEDVQEAVCEMEGYAGLHDILLGFPKTKREHIVDAVAVAICSLDGDIARLRGRSR